MALRQTLMPTLLDVATVTGADGSILDLVEILSMRNEMLDDMVFCEANDGLGHRSAIRTGLPTGTWRRAYGGVQPSKATSAPVRDTIGNYEAYGEVDKMVADMNGNAARFRLTEEMAQIESMNQEIQSTLIYGNESADSAKFTGLAARFNTLSGSASSDNVINAGGVGSNLCSIYLVVWAPQTVCALYPKGSKAGLSINDKGAVTIENIDGVNGRMEAYRTHYQWMIGLHVRDWRYVVRIANIDHAALTLTMATGPNLIDLMTQALEVVPSLSIGHAAFYMPKKLRSFARRQIANRVINSTLTMDQVAGKSVISFDNIPVRRVDSMLLTETALV